MSEHSPTAETGTGDRRQPLRLETYESRPAPPVTRHHTGHGYDGAGCGEDAADPAWRGL